MDILKFFQKKKLIFNLIVFQDFVIAEQKYFYKNQPISKKLKIFCDIYNKGLGVEKCKQVKTKKKRNKRKIKLKLINKKEKIFINNKNKSRKFCK